MAAAVVAQSPGTSAASRTVRARRAGPGRQLQERVSPPNSSRSPSHDHSPATDTDTVDGRYGWGLVREVPPEEARPWTPVDAPPPGATRMCRDGCGPAPATRPLPLAGPTRLDVRPRRTRSSSSAPSPDDRLRDERGVMSLPTGSLHLEGASAVSRPVTTGHGAPRRGHDRRGCAGLRRPGMPDTYAVGDPRPVPGARSHPRPVCR